MILVGRLGAEAITAVGLSFQPFWLLQGLFMGLGAGTTALVARLTGAGDPEGAVRVTQQSLLVATALALLCGLVTVPFSRQIVILMGAQAGVVELAEAYLDRLLPGLLVMMVATVLGGALRGAGDTRTPMWANVVVNILNLVLSWALIYGRLGFPALGVAGAGLAATLARVVGTGVLLLALLTGRTVLDLRPGRLGGAAALLRLDAATVARLLRVGLPAAGERVVNNLGQILYTRVVASLGTVAFAAHSLALNVESLSYMPGLAFSVAAATLVGQSLGAHRPDQAARSGWECNQMALWVMGLMGAVFFLAPAPLLRLYTADERVISQGVVALRIVAFTQLPEAVGFVLSGALRGAGDTRSVLWITVAGVWVVRLGLSLLFVPVLGLGLVGAWLAMFLDWVVRAGYLIARFRAGAWKEVRV